MPGKAGQWGWTDDGGRTTASIGWRSEAGAVVLDYTLNGLPTRQRVPVLHSSCHYGGARAWFGCPDCGRRVALLYLRGSGFACRHCQRLGYSSQSEDVTGRAWRKQRKAEARMGPDHRRPKGMHRTTHARLLGVVAACETQRTAALAFWLDRHAPGWRGR